MTDSIPSFGTRLELPGGGMDAGETREQCLHREVAEEIGWSVRVGAFLDTALMMGAIAAIRYRERAAT